MMKRAICVALSLLGAMVAWPSAVMAQATVSAGCQALNDPALDATYRLREVGPLEFFAGETIAVVAGTSPDPADDVRFQVLSETGAIIETQGGPVPAAFSFTVPTDTNLTARWLVLGPLSASWTVSCTAAPYPLAVSAAPPATDAAAPPAPFPSDSSAGFP